MNQTSGAGIGRLAARDFCAEMLELEPGSLTSMEGFPSSIVSRYQKLLDEVDELYDSPAQTFHGSNANQQAIWEAWILDYRLTGLTSRAWHKSPEGRHC